MEPIPPLGPYPDAESQANLPPSEWQACLDVWLLSLEYRLRQTDARFSQLSSSLEHNGISFLKSYILAWPRHAKTVGTGKEAQLHRRSYLLLRRLLLTTQVVADIGPSTIVDLVIEASHPYHSVGDWPRLVSALSEKFPKLFSTGFELWKSKAAKLFEDSRNDSESIRNLRTINSLLRVYADAGTRLMTGSDYLESVIDVYRRHSEPSDRQDLRQLLIEHLYLCLRNLMSDKARHPSLLLDQLYVLRTDADRLEKKKIETKTLLASLLCMTSFLRHLAGDGAIVDSKRGRDMLDALFAYREQTKHLFPAPVTRQRKAEKGKGRADETEEMHIHRAAQVSQIHELFPDLSDGYIMRLLDHFGDDVEQTTAALLEPASLPPALQDTSVQNDNHELQPKSSLPKPAQLARSSVPQRKNVFDNDDFDKLRISSKQLHQGRRKISIADPELPDEKSRSKAAILAALSALDEDEDERDDTYDVADVGGSVDQSIDTDRRPKAEQNPNEEVLYKAWKDSTALFARDSKTRISPVRQDMKRQTGMSDEQIEGWAIMLSRDQALQRRLQQRYSVTNTFRGNQSHLQPTSWQQATSGENSMDESDDRKHDTGDESGMSEDISRSNSTAGRGRGRGRGGGRGDFGGAGGASESGSDRGRGRGRGRGGRANHNRREGRAKKMNRGMAGGPAS